VEDVHDVKRVKSFDEKLTIRVYDDNLQPSIQSAMLPSSRIRVSIVKEPTLLVKRFYPFNVMHILHDDLLGYAGQWDFWGLDRYQRPRLVVYDHGHANPHDQIYNWLGPKMQRIDELMGWPHWVGDKTVRRSEFVCFQDAIIGTSKDQTWYQYGYEVPQGPLPALNATGWRIRDITKGILSRMDLNLWNTKQQARFLEGHYKNNTDPNDLIIGIFSRKINRLILNEDELASTLTTIFGLPVVFLRMEEMSLTTIAKYMSRTAVAFGMHGSLLAMAMFMPPGSILIEGYPYGVPPENYSPYSTMSKLPGMFLTYRAWKCMDAKAIVGHPERKADKGGIQHLSELEQNAILQADTIQPHLCCSNPHWLYRIYQDTNVNAVEIIALIHSAIPEALASLPHNWR